MWSGRGYMGEGRSNIMKKQVSDEKDQGDKAYNKLI